jgi:diguanylate cyclase (GGDEF)-like protein
MLVPAASAPIALDLTTLFVIATCVTALLGLFLLSAWAQERIRALAWWGTAYLIGGFSVAVWSIEGLISPPLPAGAANALLFVACGMIWSAARLFHGRPVLWGAMFAGAVVWLFACLFSQFLESATARVVLSSLIVASYTFLTAAELWRERRKTLLRRWPAIFVPILHGTVFLFPIPLASMLPSDGGIVSLASGWLAVFALETMLYVVGTAFIVLVLAKERSVRVLRDAASVDELTGLLNRRGFFAGAHQLVQRQAKKGEPVSVLMFDLDHFKSINDRFGHPVGDDTLRVFASVVGSNMRANDVVARFGGEEFIAMLPGNLADATVAAERVRKAFEAAAGKIAGCELNATVSVGAACGGIDVASLIATADAALYRAKSNGRNRVEGIEQGLLPAGASSAPGLVPAADAQGSFAWHVEAAPKGAETVPAA